MNAANQSEKAQRNAVLPAAGEDVLGLARSAALALPGEQAGEE